MGKRKGKDKGKKNKDLFYRVNERIRAREVQVIGPDGNNLGIMRTIDAINLAREMGLDLVEVAPNANPPVARILDYGKFLYSQKKKLKEAKKKQASAETKELKLTPNIDKHDLEVKLRKAREMLEDGHKVRFRLVFRGRQIVHPEIARDLMRRIADELSDMAEVEQDIKGEGRIMTMVLRPVSKKK